MGKTGHRNRQIVLEIKIEQTHWNRKIFERNQIQIPSPSVSETER